MHGLDADKRPCFCLQPEKQIHVSGTSHPKSNQTESCSPRGMECCVDREMALGVASALIRSEALVAPPAVNASTIPRFRSALYPKSSAVTTNRRRLMSPSASSLSVQQEQYQSFNYNSNSISRRPKFHHPNRQHLHFQAARWKTEWLVSVASVVVIVVKQHQTAPPKPNYDHVTSEHHHACGLDADKIRRNLKKIAQRPNRANPGLPPPAQNPGPTPANFAITARIHQISQRFTHNCFVCFWVSPDVFVVAFQWVRQIDFVLVLLSMRKLRFVHHRIGVIRLGFALVDLYVLVDLCDLQYGLYCARAVLSRHWSWFQVLLQVLRVPDVAVSLGVGVILFTILPHDILRVRVVSLPVLHFRSCCCSITWTKEGEITITVDALRGQNWRIYLEDQATQLGQDLQPPWCAI